MERDKLTIQGLPVEDLDSSNEIYVRYRDNLERCLDRLEKEGVSAFMLYAYARAKEMPRDAADSIASDEDYDESNPHTIWNEWAGQLDASMDDAKDFVQGEFHEIYEAMGALYGVKCPNCEGQPRNEHGTCDVCEGKGWVQG